MSERTGTTGSDEPRHDHFLNEPSALLQGLENAGVGVWRWHVDGGRLNWTRNLPALHNLADSEFDGTIDSFAKDIHPDDTEPVWATIQGAVESGEPFHVIYRSALAPVETPVWIEARGCLSRDGEARVLTGVCHDATERVLARGELEKRLKQQKAVAALGSYALDTRDFDAVLAQAVSSAAEVLDTPIAKVMQLVDTADNLLLKACIGMGVEVIGHAMIPADPASLAGNTLASNAPIIVTDFTEEDRFDIPPLLAEHGVVSGLSVTIAGGDGRPYGLFGVFATHRRVFDAADAEFLLALANIVASASRQSSASTYKEMLVREMAHRAGNMLQFVSSIASQTFREEVDQAVARRAFSDRLSSLARANYLIAKGGWTQTRLTVLTEEILRPFVDRVRPRGRDVLLSPDLSFDLGLILQELAMTSSRHGALSFEDGAVDLDWSIEPGDQPEAFLLTLHWRDVAALTDMPQLPPPTRTGFGSRLISTLVERKWHGKVQIETEPAYHFSFAIPLP